MGDYLVLSVIPELHGDSPGGVEQTPSATSGIRANGHVVKRRRLRGAGLACGTRQQGFSLIEALIALTILAITLAGLALLITSNIETNGEARRQSAANALAQAKLEELMATGYSAVASSTSAESLDETGGTTGATFFTRSWVVGNGPVTQSKTLSVTVAWTDKSGAHQVMLQTIISL